MLHEDELTYSLICRQDDPLLGGCVEATNRIIGQCLVAGLKLFGVEATLVRTGGRSVRPRWMGVTLPCFSSTTRWEVKCRDRKLIGSAQRRADGVILQHGSLLIGPSHLELLDLLVSVPVSLKEEWREQLEQSSTCLEDCLGRPVDIEALASCLIEGFRRQLSVEMESDFLTLEEEERVEILVKEGYGDPFWNRGAQEDEIAGVKCPAAAER